MTPGGSNALPIRALAGAILRPDSLLEVEPELAYLGGRGAAPDRVRRRRTAEWGWGGWRKVAAGGERVRPDRREEPQPCLGSYQLQNRGPGGKVAERRRPGWSWLDAATRAGDEGVSWQRLLATTGGGAHAETSTRRRRWRPRRTGPTRRLRSGLGYPERAWPSPHRATWGSSNRGRMGLLDRAQGHFHEAAAHARPTAERRGARVEQERALPAPLQAGLPGHWWPGQRRSGPGVRATGPLGDRGGIGGDGAGGGAGPPGAGRGGRCRTALAGPRRGWPGRRGAALPGSEVLEGLAGVALRQGESA